MSAIWHGIRLYVGGDAQNVQRRRVDLTGFRCFSGAYGPKSRFTPAEAEQVIGMLDSGAFSDATEDRLAPEEALQRQLRWEREAGRFWGAPWRAESLVSYDQLIDEKWTGKARIKSRWSVADADSAVRVTVDAAKYLSSQRTTIAPRQCVLATQGVDAIQYAECAAGVLEHCRPGDIFGLGGWCILGWFRSWMPVFWAAVRRVLPMVAHTGIDRVHIFGVLFRPVLGPLLWLCHQYGLNLSTDSSGPMLQPTWKDRVKSGAYCETWEKNVEYWKNALETLHESEYYHEPPMGRSCRQTTLFV